MPDAGTAYIGIERAGPTGQVTVRADLGDPTAGEAVAAAIGLDVPGPLGVTHQGGRRLVWMSPDEVLYLVAPDEVPEAIDALEEALADHHHMVLDVSDARAVFRLTGEAVGEVLAKGAACDLSDRACPPGTARRTHLAGLAVGLWRLEAEAWEVVCFRSYAHHLDAWLATAAMPGSEVG